VHAVVGLAPWRISSSGGTGTHGHGHYRHDSQESR
jgi:hypothetical protein